MTYGRVERLGSLPGNWAKLGYKNGELKWHSIEGHAADIAAVCELLLTNTVIAARFATLAGRSSLEASDIAKLCVLAGIHDIGKASYGFQRQVLDGYRGKLPSGHCPIVLAGLVMGTRSTPRKFAAALHFEKLSQILCDGDFNLFWEYINALMGHHGRPLSQQDISLVAASGMASWGLDVPASSVAPLENPSSSEGLSPPLLAARKVVEAVISWYPAAMSGHSLPGDNAFIHAFSGLITLSDWIASDTSFFDLDNGGDSSARIISSRLAARNVLESIGLTGGHFTEELKDIPLEFQALFGFPPHPAQAAMAKFDDIPPGSVTVLEAETGSGKTEAAIRHFLGLQKAGKVDGMYFALPLRTAAVQIAHRVATDLARIAPRSTSYLPVTTAVPGYLDSSVNSYSLPDDLAVPHTDTDWGSGVIRKGWAADQPKKFLASVVAVGTIDQALLGVVRTRHAHLRATSHLRQLLIVDEVHSSDIYMHHLLKELISRHKRAGGHVLLMSATLGAHSRNSFLGEEHADYNEAVTYPYPAISATGGRRMNLSSMETTQTTSKVVKVESCPYDDEAQIVDLIQSAVLDGARVLVIRNRVDSAVALQKHLEELSVPTLQVRGKPTLHHSRFTREDRVLLDEAIIASLGKDSLNPIAVVATQTAEQSLDIDADLIITDLAPADILLQRFGRLHRHPRRDARPSNYINPRAVIISPTPDLFDEQLKQALLQKGRPRWRNGWGTVYPNLLSLHCTLEALMDAGEIRIPTMNRELVEKATHPEWLAKTATLLGEHWEQHRINLTGQGLAERGQSTNALYSWNDPYSTTSFNKASDEIISTRLGANDRLIEFPERIIGPFGNDAGELRIPAWMTRHVGDDEQPVMATLQSHGEIAFSFGKQDFIYNRLGLSISEKLSGGTFKEGGIE